MIHARTYEQGFSGQPDWTIVKKARRIFPGILIANGSIDSTQTACQVLKLTQADGLSIGRSAIGRPWIFSEIKRNLTLSGKLKLQQIFNIIIEHAQLAYDNKGRLGIIELRKHLVRYVAGLPKAKQLRERLVKAETVKDVENVFK